MQKENYQTKYTVIPIVQIEHQERLKTYLSKDNQNLKSSYCRFYLRGNCIMKPEYCKFAHSFQQLKIVEEETSSDYLTEKQRRKKQFLHRKDFNQKALFIIHNIQYYGLYQYQFSQRFKKKNLPICTVQQITTDRNKRIRIREVLQRQNWNNFMLKLQNVFPNVDFTISFLSNWFQKVGFAKPQSRCKFGDFLRYIIHVMNYKDIYFMMPPKTQNALYFVNTNRKVTLLQTQIDKLKKVEQQRKEQKVKIIQKQLPFDLYKKYFCRFYMSGNCHMDSDKCVYAHSVSQLQYQKGQEFPAQYKQLNRSSELKSNYYSLFKFHQMKGTKILLKQLNESSTLRGQMRRQMHRQIYSDFLALLQRQWQIQKIRLSFLEREYFNVGFNHSDQNKFGQLIDMLWDIGYHTQSVLMPPILKVKVNYAYKLPTIQDADKQYSKKIQNSIKQELKKSPNDKILQSALRRNIYSTQQYFQIPLHIYLKLKKKTFEEIVKEILPNLSKDIFFQTGQSNYKLLLQITKKYFKTSKNYIHRFEDIQNYVKQHHQNSINLNHFVNLRSCIQIAVLEAGKKFYFFPFGQNNYVLDKNHFSQHQKATIKILKKIQQKQDVKLQSNEFSEEMKVYVDQRVVVVDDEISFRYSSLVIQKTHVYGVDLQGKLRKQGKIDLIQISIKKQNGKKQIFIFDMFLMYQKKEKTQLYLQVVNFLRSILENEQKVKILHDCRADSVALHYSIGISIKNVFDTSGMDVYFQQKTIYENQTKSQHILKKIHAIKVPGLNNVLDKWQAPNGVNIFKDEMKKKFGSWNRPYFQKRPIDEQFKQYSAQDVQDLIDVYEKMIIKDTQLLRGFIGSIYSKVDINQDELEITQQQNANIQCQK